MFPFRLYNSTKEEERSQFHILSGAKHTYYRVIYNHHISLDEEILHVYNDLYRSINPFDPRSTISKVNRNEDVYLDDFFIDAFKRSIELAKETSGLFDPTCAPLINLWGFGFGERSEATPAAIDAIKEYVGYQKIKLNGCSVEKQDPRVQLNFSAIGDGFSCEVIARYLDQQGVKDYLIDIGGEMVIKGKNRTGEDWKVGIIQPPKELGMNEPLQTNAMLYISGKTALATSGNYNNYKIENGKKFGHSINPLTGYPAENKILSATVLAPDCITAEAYATAIMVSDLDCLDQLLETHQPVEYYIIYLDSSKNHQVRQSYGMSKYMQQKNLSHL
ncbi:MAG: FAD:protein FMN transferase [Tannerella sp.]|jgi:thiamine biosynthesis lipoprotein|nr:FAD:protein FMN transferase [Tannerella sp.]